MQFNLNIYMTRLLLLSVLIGLLTACGGGGGGSGAGASPAKAITAYTLSGVVGTIDETNKTIEVTVPFGTSVTALVATFTTTGTSVTVGVTAQTSGATANDFTSPVTYTVTAADGSSVNYTVTVTVALSSAKAMNAFSLAGAAGIIDDTNKTIAVTVPFGTNITALVATFTTTGVSIKVGATAQTSGITANNFTTPVTYTVIAADGSTVSYTVTVTVALSSAKAITAYTLGGVVGIINEASKVISVALPGSTNVTALVATFTATGASVKVGTTAQTSGITANNFTAPVTYTVTATDGSTVSYTVTLGAVIGGMVQGLEAGKSLVLRNNAVDSLTVAANGAFAFPTLLNNNATYSVSIATLPTGQPCTLTYGAGTVSGANVSNVNVICGPTFVGSFLTTGSLAIAREQHTATLLPNGKVLVTGGADGANRIATCELYDPVSGLWSSTGSLSTARQGHTATLLPSGKLLVVGGLGLVGNVVTDVAIAELYDPSTGVWSTTGSLAFGRSWHTATLLPNGKVLVAGGDHFGIPSATAELYDSVTGLWSTTGSLSTVRGGHTATLLPSGKVLVVAGYYGSSSGLTGAELYDPATGVWSATGSLATGGRWNHTTTLLPNGKVLVAGGYGFPGWISSAEVYEPATGVWSATGSMITARDSYTSTLLPNGKVLVAGGPALALTELYDPLAGTWVATGSMATARQNHTVTLLPSGKVLVVGGAGGGVSVTAELYW